MSRLKGNTVFWNVSSQMQPTNRVDEVVVEGSNGDPWHSAPNMLWPFAPKGLDKIPLRMCRISTCPFAS